MADLEHGHAHARQGEHFIPRPLQHPQRQDRWAWREVVDSFGRRPDTAVRHWLVLHPGLPAPSHRLRPAAVSLSRSGLRPQTNGRTFTRVGTLGRKAWQPRAQNKSRPPHWSTGRISRRRGGGVRRGRERCRGRGHRRQPGRPGLGRRERGCPCRHRRLLRIDGEGAAVVGKGL